MNALEERFWSKVIKTETCWNWQGYCAKGVGPRLNRVFPEKGTISAARYSYELHIGPAPTNKRVEQICGNRACVNPVHLLVRSEQDRFWSFVQKLSEPDGCWVWVGAQDEDMYGLFTNDQRKLYKAHRYSWELANKYVISTPLLHVCHKCDHPWCVNPEHLFLGTTQENTEDRDKKGRASKGVKHWKARLTESDIVSIRQSQLGLSELGRQYGVSPSHIARIRKRILWKEVA